MAHLHSMTFQRRGLSLVMDFAISRGTMTLADNIFVTITDVDGNIGIGEAAPFPVLTGDTADMVAQLLGQLASSLPGNTLDAALGLIRGSWRHELFGASPTTLTALEMALMDLQAKRRAQSFGSLLGSARCTSHVTDVTIPVCPAHEARSFWLSMASRGFRDVKVKVGGESLSEDVDRVVALKDCLPARARLSLDGNQGFTVTTALTLLAKLKSAGIVPAVFEQPLPWDDWHGMQTITEQSPVPICADELVRTRDDAHRVVRDHCAHMINLKISKSGIAESLEIARMARAAGLTLMIGGMLETEVAMTASLWLAGSLGGVDWLDLDTPFFIKDRVTKASPWHDDRAELLLPRDSTDGLGLELLGLVV